MASKGLSLLVAAFDFGTTYSGYAFSFRNDPLKVHTNQNWIAGSEKLISLKTPTCLLLKQNGEFHSFGFEAENKYALLAEDGDHHGWRLFRRFKMILHSNSDLSRFTTVEDMEGTSMEALPLFAMSIRFLWQHLLDAIDKQTSGVHEVDIHYVITVPAIWDDNAKQFMREAAIEAGIDTRRLKLALEPEAASIWCQLVTSEAQAALAGERTQYMVVDLGGGTADISVHEKQAGGKLKEIHKASGGPWGGIFVDQNYMKMLGKIFDERALDDLKTEEMGDYFDILREFETKKRNFGATASETVTFRISSALREASEKYSKQSLNDKVSGMEFGEKIVVRGKDKLRVDESIVKEWFDGPISSVIGHIKSLLREPKMSAVNSILLVGGFGESQYVRKRMTAEIQNKRLIVPNEAGLVVLKGAVRFGHDTGIVAKRIMPYTYGIRGKTQYEAGRHPPERMVLVNGREKVQDAFIIFVRAGEETSVGQEYTQGRDPSIKPDFTTFPVFRSADPDPIFTTDPGCHQIGFLKVFHPEGETRMDKKMDVTFILGDTELMVKVRMRKTGGEFFLSINCLG